jgi:hypothetical protein
MLTRQFSVRADDPSLSDATASYGMLQNMINLTKGNARGRVIVSSLNTPHSTLTLLQLSSIHHPLPSLSYHCAWSVELSPEGEDNELEIANGVPQTFVPVCGTRCTCLDHLLQRPAVLSCMVIGIMVCFILSVVPLQPSLAGAIVYLIAVLLLVLPILTWYDRVLIGYLCRTSFFYAYSLLNWLAYVAVLLARLTIEHKNNTWAVNPDWWYGLSKTLAWSMALFYTLSIDALPQLRERSSSFIVVVLTMVLINGIWLLACYRFNILINPNQQAAGQTMIVAFGFQSSIDSLQQNFLVTVMLFVSRYLFAYIRSPVYFMSLQGTVIVQVFDSANSQSSNTDATQAHTSVPSRGATLIVSRGSVTGRFTQRAQRIVALTMALTPHDFVTSVDGDDIHNAIRPSHTFRCFNWFDLEFSPPKPVDPVIRSEFLTALWRKPWFPYTMWFCLLAALTATQLFKTILCSVTVFITTFSALVMVLNRTDRSILKLLAWRSISSFEYLYLVFICTCFCTFGLIEYHSNAAVTAAYLKMCETANKHDITLACTHMHTL